MDSCETLHKWPNSEWQTKQWGLLMFKLRSKKNMTLLSGPYFILHSIRKIEMPLFLAHWSVIWVLNNFTRQHVPSWMAASWLDSAGNSSAEPDSGAELAVVSSSVDTVGGASLGVTLADFSSAVWSCGHNSVHFNKQQQNESNSRWEEGKPLSVVPISCYNPQKAVPRKVVRMKHKGTCDNCVS